MLLPLYAALHILSSLMLSIPWFPTARTHSCFVHSLLLVPCVGWGLHRTFFVCWIQAFIVNAVLPMP